MDALGAAAPYIPSLSYLDFSCNQLQDEQVTPLAQLLCKLKKLRFLDITKIGFTEDGLSRFAREFFPQT